MSGRLIGPKSWNRIIENFETQWTVCSSFRDCFGCLSDNLLNKSCIDVYEAGYGCGNWFQKVKQMVDEWAATDSPHALFLGLLKTVPGLRELDQNRPCVVCLNC